MTVTIDRLSQTKLTEIQAKLPNAYKIQKWLEVTLPEWVDTKTTPSSRLSVALICLQDAARVAWEVDYGLLYAYANVTWYRDEDPDVPIEELQESQVTTTEWGELQAHRYGKYYADDAALRLYGAAEYAAQFVVEFLNIQSAELDDFREKRTSLAIAVGKYLKSKMASHEISVAVGRLSSNKDWQRTMAYRNDWVHEQPQLVSTPALRYKRRMRWRDTQAGPMMLIGGDAWGDRPDLTLDELLEMIRHAGCAFVETLEELSEILFKNLEPLGIVRDFNSGRILVKG